MLGSLARSASSPAVHQPTLPVIGFNPFGVAGGALGADPQLTRQRSRSGRGFQQKQTLLCGQLAAQFPKLDVATPMR